MRASLIGRLLLLSFMFACGLIFVTGCGKAPENANAATLESNATTADAPGGERLPFGGRVGGAGKSQEGGRVTVPAGTPMTVRMQSSVSSAHAQGGERFDAVLDSPISVEGRTVVPAGASVTGRVVSARSSGRLQNPGYLKLTLASVTINGKEVPVQTSSVSAQGKSHKKRNLAMIGGGSGAGALIGALAGGGKGALIGAGVGAAAGTTGAYATGKKEVAFGAERRLTFRLTQPVVVD